MSTLKTTNLQHPSAESPAIVLDADGDATYAGVHDFSAATVTGAPQGLVLVSPTSIANSGGSASASGGEVSFTGVTSISLNGVFDISGAGRYLIQYTINSSTTNTALNFRWRVSGADSTGTNYIHSGVTSNNGTVAGLNQPDIAYVTVGGISTNHPQNSFGSIDVALDNRAKLIASWSGSLSNGTKGAWGVNGGFNWTINSSMVDGFTIYTGGAGITGTISVYGYRRA